MNEHLKFSWGHIIAFLALIYISYMSFVGATYFTGGDFLMAFVIMIVVDITLLTFFVGAQYMKATEKRFKKRIWLERFFIFGSPAVFVFSMLPYCHFSTVQSKESDVVNQFTDALKSSESLFSEYEFYSYERIDNYESMLRRVISNRKVKPNEFLACGFDNGSELIQKENMIETLRQQLLSDNYYMLKEEALNWIESSDNNLSTWNVFLLGNIRQIKKAMREWNDQMSLFTSITLSNEEFNGYNMVQVYDSPSVSLLNIDNRLDGIVAMFTETSIPSFTAIIQTIILYVILLIPYLLQSRHTKSHLKLIAQTKKNNISNEGCVEYDSSDSEEGYDDYKSFKL